VLITVAETQSYLARAAKLLGEAEREAIVLEVASNPRAGVVIRGTGGLRKLRVGVQGRGKRGGARVIYYFHSERMPVYLLAIFAKNERVDLTPSERAQLKKLVDVLVEERLGTKEGT
jgi:hypothetical protein